MFRRVVHGTKCLSLAIIPIPLLIFAHTEVEAPRGLTAPISSEVPHRGVGVNSGRKLGGDTPTIPEANRRTHEAPRANHPSSG